MRVSPSRKLRLRIIQRPRLGNLDTIIRTSVGAVREPPSVRRSCPANRPEPPISTHAQQAGQNRHTPFTPRFPHRQIPLFHSPQGNFHFSTKLTLFALARMPRIRHICREPCSQTACSQSPFQPFVVSLSNHERSLAPSHSPSSSAPSRCSIPRKTPA